LAATVVAPAPSRAGDGDEHAADRTPARRAAHDRRPEHPGHGVWHQGLIQELRRPQLARDLAVEVAVLLVADDQDADVGVHDLRQLTQQAERVVLAGHVHQQRLGRRHVAELRDRIAQADAPDVELAGDRFRQALPQRGFGLQVGCEGHQCAAGGFRLLCAGRGYVQTIWHLTAPLLLRRR